MSWWAAFLLIPAVFVAIGNWRNGLLAMLVVVFLQDPARKLEIDQPVYFTLLAGIVLAVVYVRAQTVRAFWPTQLVGWNRYMRGPSVAFALVLFIQACVSIVRYGNPIIAGIGAVSYLAPLPAVLLGYNYALKTGDRGIKRWMAWYLVGALIVLPSLAAEFMGIESDLLGQVGIGFEMYQDDAILTAHSGFFRASETAAWHTATAVCFLLLLSSMRKLSSRQTVAAIAVIVFLLTLGMLTGRRKIFVEIVIFMSVYVSQLLLFGKGGLKWAGSVFAGGLLSYVAVSWLVVEKADDFSEKTGGVFHYYAQRSATVTGDITDRFLGLGLDPVEWAIAGFGWFGGGLGVASQGAQHFGGGAEVYGGSGEGGLGKITAELGVPGLLITVWFIFSAVRYGWQVLKFVAARSPAMSRLAFGLLAFLVANFAVFFIATQVFGDVSVLIILGLMAGFFLATPVLAERERLGPATKASPVVPARQRFVGRPDVPRPDLRR